MFTKQSMLSRWSRILLDIFILIMGIVLCTGAAVSGNVAEVVLGALFIFYGTVMIGTSERERGEGRPGQSRIGMALDIVWIVLGMLSLVTAGDGHGAGWAFKLVLGIWMILAGFRVWIGSREDNYESSARLTMYLGIAQVVLGILVVCSMAAPQLMAGICMIIYAIVALFGTVRGWLGGARR